MTSKSTYMLVGAFVLVLGAAFIWGVLWISAGGTPQSIDRYLVYMEDSVSGLNVDAPLRYRGVDVGKVEKISIDERNPERIRLVLQVRQGTPVSADTVATLEYQGLTGIASVNLSGGTAASPSLGPTPGEEFPVIQSRASFLSRLDKTLDGLLANLTQTSQSINEVLGDENRVNVARSIENVAVLTERIAQQSAQLESIINHLEATLRNTSVASADFPALVQQFSRSAESITAMADEIRAVGENLSSASGTIGAAVDASSADLVQFTGTVLPEMAALLEDLRVAALNLRRMSETLEQDPSVLLRGNPEPIPGPGE
jgi:phospholipid/cholesterol/gamma-HCH transport system substrate-binding protein